MRAIVSALLLTFKKHFYIIFRNKENVIKYVEGFVMDSKRAKNTSKIAYTKLLCEDAEIGKIKISQVPEILAKKTGMSERQARKYRKIAMDGTEEVITAFENGDISINDAETIVKHPVDEQSKLVEKYKSLKYGEKAKEIINDGGYAGYVPSGNKLPLKSLNGKIQTLIEISTEIISLDVSEIKDCDSYSLLVTATRKLARHLT